jgi:Iap family predicted aminopeptidase
MKINIIVISAFVLIAVLLSGCGQKNIPVFDGDRAYQYLKEQCDFGPRNPNGQGHRECLQYLYDKLAETTNICRKQSFIYYDSVRQDTLRLTNVIASFNPKSQRRVMLCAHWDTRPWADRDPDTLNHNKPILGANDGASGVAVLLELASILKENSPSIGIDIAFFDGEDYGMEGHTEGWLLGSKYFVQNIGGYRPSLVILLDMIGDSDLQIYKEVYSSTYAGRYVDLIWKIAGLEKARHFKPESKHSVYDDHIPFLQAGIPAVDIIDIEYEYWHMLADTPDKCSIESLTEVGRVIVRLIYDTEVGLGAK